MAPKPDEMNPLAFLDTSKPIQWTPERINAVLRYCPSVYKQHLPEIERQRVLGATLRAVAARQAQDERERAYVLQAMRKGK